MKRSSSTVNGVPVSGMSQTAETLLVYLAGGTLYDRDEFTISHNGEPVDFDAFAYRVYQDVRSTGDEP